MSSHLLDKIPIEQEAITTIKQRSINAAVAKIVISIIAFNYINERAILFSAARLTISPFRNH